MWDQHKVNFYLFTLSGTPITGPITESPSQPSPSRTRVQFSKMVSPAKKSKSGNSQGNTGPTIPSFTADSRAILGTIPTFLLDRSAFLTDPELFGAPLLDPHDVRVKVIHEFYMRHEAMLQLNQAGPSSSSSNSAELSSSSAYRLSLEQFVETQMTRQSSSLRTNLERGTATDATGVIRSHRLALETNLKRATEQPERIFDQTLVQFTNALCRGETTPGTTATLGAGGGYRSGSVRAGSTVFCPANVVAKEMQNFFQIVQIMATQRLSDVFQTSSQRRDGKHRVLLRSVALAVVSLIGFLDIHPFRDGNGRTARILVNWALRRDGFPFCINLCASPAQRTGYVQAIRQTRANIMHYIFSSSCQKGEGLLEPCVNLILDRLSAVVQEFNRDLNARITASRHDEEAKAIRRHREQAALGTCIICLDEKPNIATLCCGNAVHLKCLAEWLSRNATCVVCRIALPQLEPRPEIANVPTPASSTHTHLGVSYAAYAAAVYAAAAHPTSDIAAAADDDTTDSTTSDIYDDDTTDETTEMEYDTTDETTVAVVQNTQPPGRPECEWFSCRNRRAMDCTNSLCGGCCVLRGTYGCSRHQR